MNSLLWELMDGTRNLGDIFRIMDSTFHERIAPVEERVEASVTNLMSLGLVVLRMTQISGEWVTSPLHDPSGTLPTSDPTLDIIEEE